MNQPADRADQQTTDNPSWLVHQHPKVAEAFANIRGTIPMATEQTDTMLRIIRYFQPEPKRRLDLGCGDGPAAGAKSFGGVPREFYGTLVVDHSKPMLDLAQAKLAGYQNIDFEQGDFNKGDFMMSLFRAFPFIMSPNQESERCINKFSTF
jgi:ubiquinone/menaquinone biosynthesis C-methylase UbiE